MKVWYLFFCLYPFFLSAQTPDRSDWQIPAGPIDPNNYYGVTLANGMVGLISSSDPMQVQDVVLNGVYDRYQRGRVSNILKTFSHMNLSLVINGQNVNRNSISDYDQVLDMHAAQFLTSFRLGKLAKVSQKLMSLRNMPYTAMSVVEITALQDIEITASNAIMAPDHLSDIRNYFSQIDRPHTLLSLLSSEARSPGGIKVATSTAFIFSDAHGSEPSIIHEEWDYNRHTAKFTRQISKGETYRFAIVGSTLSEMHNGDPRNEAERLTIFAKLEGIDRMMTAHQKAWAKLWESDVIVAGDLQSQRAIRSAIYHLYSFACKGSNLSLSPMGLSGLGYNGHVFWDTELWMYPPLLVLQPDIAKSLLEYRFERLEAAKANAFAHGFDGAMFPWESADDGAEQTPVWALTGPFQQHISATIGWAFWKYYQVTGDKGWLASRGYPVLLEVAKFWISRVEKNDNGNYDISNVIGANEFEENIDNNAFTNGMVKTVLEYAASAAEALGKEPDPQWRAVSAAIRIVKFPDGTTRENETYKGQEIKQADATLLSYPLKLVSDQSDIRRDLEYYHPRLSTSGPAMGVAISATLYARLGDAEQAFELFKKSYKPNEVPPFGVLAETMGGTNPYFATGAGGMLQSVLFGFGGLDITDEGILSIGMNLPKQWRSLKMTGIGIGEKTIE